MLVPESLYTGLDSCEVSSLAERCVLLPEPGREPVRFSACLKGSSDLLPLRMLSLKDTLQPATGVLVPVTGRL